MATDLSRLQQVKSNYARILILLTEVIANPTQANIDAIIDAAGSASIVSPKPTYSADGVSYDWTGYQSFIIQQYEQLMKLIALESGPYEIRSVGF